MASASTLDQRLFDAYAAAVGLAFLAIIPLAWVGGPASLFRNWQIALNALLFIALLARSGSRPWEAPVSRPLVAALAGCALLAWSMAQLFKFQGFLVNAADFSIFDWMLYNTNHGRFMYSPVYEVNHFGIHPSYVMLPLVPLHRLFETPLFLVAVNVLALWAAIFPLWRLAARRWSEAAALLLVVAYLSNPWTLALLDGAFRPEVFYPLFGLLFLLGWVEESRRLWLPALVAFLCIKEDAGLTAAAFGAGALLFEPGRRGEALGVLGAGLLVLGVDVGVVQPSIMKHYPNATVAFGRMWAGYGTSFGEIARTMLGSPLRVAGDVLTSAWSRMFWPALFLPLLSRRALPAMLPTLLVLGTASSPMMRKYQWYYPIPLVPLLFFGLVEAHRELPLLRSRPGAREVLFLSAALLFPLVGGGYLALRPPDAALRAAFATVQARLAAEPGVVCVQHSVFPQLGYARNLAVLTARCAGAPDALTLLNPGLDEDPFPPGLLLRLTERARAEGRAESFGQGFFLLHGPLALE